MDPLKDLVLYKIDEEDENEEKEYDNVGNFVNVLFEEVDRAGSQEEEKSQADIANDNDIADVNDDELQEEVPASITRTVSPRESRLKWCYDDDDRTDIPLESINFVLHPRPSRCGFTSSASSVGQEPEYPQEYALENKTKPSTKSVLLDLKSKAKKAVRFNSSGVPRWDNEFEITVESKPVEEILYEIATGKWPTKNLVIDDEVQGTRKLDPPLCSNARCVKEAERRRRFVERERVRQEQYEADDENENIAIFDDGNLPSYHSLIEMWKAEKNRSWERVAFRNGHPETEEEFLDAWRECRKNPAAFGVKIRAPQKLPSKSELRKESALKVAAAKAKVQHELWKCRKAAQPRLAVRDIYKNDGNSKASLEDKEKMKARYEYLRGLYPHLPALGPGDYKLNAGMVRVRLKQAEDWHRLVSLSNKTQALRSIGRRKKNVASEVNERNIDCDLKAPRYTSSTTSFLQKIKTISKNKEINA